MTTSSDPSGAETRPLLLFVHGSAEMYGSDRVLLNLASAMSRMGQYHVVVVLHESGPLRLALIEAGIEVHVATVVKVRRAMFTLLAPLLLWRLSRQCFADLDRVVAGRPVGLVHSNTLAVLGGAFWASKRRHRHLWHVHEIISKPALAGKLLCKLASRKSMQVITVSNQALAWLLSQASALGGRAEVVFNGLPAVPERDLVASQSFRDSIGAASDDVVVTLAGRLNHWKGQSLLIDAVALLQKAGKLGKLRVAIVGDVYAGHEDVRDKLAAQVQGYALDDRVRFLSFVSDIFPVWYGSQIAVVPSTEPEPFGMVAIEAMACGLPVVAAGHGGLLDIVEHERTGLLFAPGQAVALADALARLAADGPLRARLGCAGAARQHEKFSIETQIARTCAIYGRLQAANP